MGISRFADAKPDIAERVHVRKVKPKVDKSYSSWVPKGYGTGDMFRDGTANAGRDHYGGDDGGGGGGHGHHGKKGRKGGKEPQFMSRKERRALERAEADKKLCVAAPSTAWVPDTWHA